VLKKLTYLIHKQRNGAEALSFYFNSLENFQFSKLLKINNLGSSPEFVGKHYF